MGAVQLIVLADTAEPGTHLKTRGRHIAIASRVTNPKASPE